MFVEVGFQSERLPALFATVRLVRRMRLHVGSQIGLVRKRFPAHGAGVRPVP